MKNFYNKIKASITLKNIMIIMVGSMVAQGINILFQPVITRIYSPEVIGLYGLFGSVGLILSELSSLSYPFAVILPREKTNAKKIVFIATILAIASSLLVIILMPFRGPITELFNIQDLNQYFPLMSLYLLFWNVRNINIQWSVREEAFRLKSIALIVFVIFTNITKVAIGYFYPTASVLIILNFVGFLVQGLFIYKYINTKPLNLSDIKLFQFDDLLEVGKSYSDFPLYRAPQNFLSELSNSLPILLLSALYGPAFVGFYTMSTKILNIPAQLLTKSVGDVLYPQFSKFYGQGKSITPTLVKSTLSLSVIGIIPFGLVVLIGPSLFEFVLGEGWYQSGVYARWISIYLFFGFINRPATKAAIVLRLQRLMLFYQIILALIKSLALLVGFYVFHSDVLSIVLYSFAGALMNLILIIYIIIYSKKSDRVIL